MDYIRLRPHHIIAAKVAQSMTPQQLEIHQITYSRAYGEFYNRFISFLLSLTDETQIVIVDGPDYVCTELHCLYEPLCFTGRSKEVGPLMVTKMGEDCPESFRRAVAKGKDCTQADLELQDILLYGTRATFGELKTRIAA